MSDRHPCASCSAPATLFICSRCTEELKAQLLSLARGPIVNRHPTTGLLDALADVELKQTKLGNGGGHRKKGDEMPIPFLPDTGKMDKDNRPVPSPQGWATRLRANARNILTTIARDICDSRGIDVMRAFRVVPNKFIGPLMPGWTRARGQWDPATADVAIWLAGAVHAIACDESAGQWRGEVDSLVRQILRVVDRPDRRVWLGECPTWNEHARTVCGTGLWAVEDAVEARCNRCRATHDPQRLKLLLFSDLERKRVTWDKILMANKSQPEDRQVPERTLQSWRRSGRLKARGYLRPDGTCEIGRLSDDDEPLYLWPDVRKLRDEKPQKSSTGGSAHKRNINGLKVV